jgi:hypothetical protein
MMDYRQKNRFQKQIFGRAWLQPCRQSCQNSGLYPRGSLNFPPLLTENRIEKAIAGLKLGNSFTVSRTFTEQDTKAFATITRDYNPVRFNDHFAELKNFVAGRKDKPWNSRRPRDLQLRSHISR